MIKSSVFERIGSRSLDVGKREQLEKYTKIVGLIEKRIQNLEKISHKRENFKAKEAEISFYEPLFGRQDFPLLESSLKRF